MGTGNIAGLSYVAGGQGASYQDYVYISDSGGNVARGKRKGVKYIIKVL